MILLNIIKECVLFAQLFQVESTFTPCATLPAPCHNHYETRWEMLQQPAGSNQFKHGEYVFTQPGTYIIQQLEFIDEEGQHHQGVLTIDTFIIGSPPDLYEDHYVICQGDTFLPYPNTYQFGNAVWDTFPMRDRSYIVFTESEHCQSVEEFTVHVEPCESRQQDLPSPDDFGIYIPNVFSPNGDGINDQFTIYSPTYTLKQIAIYDRWGRLVSRNHPWFPQSYDIQGHYLVRAIFDIGGFDVEFYESLTLIR